MVPSAQQCLCRFFIGLVFTCGIAVTLCAQGLNYVGTIELWGERYDVHRPDIVPVALNNRQEFDLGIFGKDYVATEVGSIGSLGFGDAASFSYTGGTGFFIPADERDSGEGSLAEDINDHGVVIGWQEEFDQDRPPRAWIYSKENRLQFLDDIFPAVKALGEQRWPPDTGPVQGTKGLKINEAGWMILQGAPTGEGLEQTKVYLVSPEGVVSPLRLAPGVWLGWNSQGDFPPPPGEGASSRVINDNGQYAGTLNISEDPVEFVATRNGNPLPGGAGTYPMAINNNGWVSAYGGIIWDPNGNRTDIREVLVNQLSDSPFINSSLLYSGGNTFINDQLDVVFSGFYITHAETGIIFDALSGDLEIIDQKLIAYVGSRITIDTSVLNYGRGYFKNAKIVTQPESDLFRLISGPTPALPPAIGENEKIESVLIYDIVKPGIYSGHFAVVGNDGRGPIEEPGFDFTLHYIVPDLGMRMNASPLELAESETINLRMTITNHSDQPVNNIQLDGAITTEGSGEVVLIEDPVAPVIPSLQPGAEVDLVYSYKADFPGQVFFRGRVKGQKESGELTISPSTVSNEIKIVPPVEISIRAKPFVGEGDNALPIVNMELDEEGNIRNEDGNIIVPKVEVTFENLGEKNVLILLQAITPFARDRTPLVDRIDVFQGSGLSQNPNQEFPFDMGTLGPGERKSIEYPLIIRKDGRFEFRAFATGRYEERPGQFNLIVQDAPIGVGQKYPLEIEIKLADQLNQVVGVGNGSHKIPPGSRVTVLGTLRNRTSNMKIQVNAIDAMATRNAFGGVITDQTLAGGNPMPGTDVLAPFTIDQELTPGQSIVLQGIIITDPNGAPSGTVTWELPEDGVLIDLQTQEEKDLEKEDILLKSEIGGWDSDPLTMRLIQDNSRPPLPPLEWWEPAKHYTEGVMYGIGSWTYNTLDSVGAIGRGAGTASNYIDSAEDIVDLMGQGGLALLHAGEYVKNTWEEMTAEQVEQFLLVVAKEVQRRGQLSFKDKVVEDIENLNSVLAVVREKTLPLFNNVADVYASDDPRQIAELWGEVSGNVIAEVATSFVPSPKFTRYAEAGELAKLAKNADNIRPPGGQEAFLQALKSGPVDEAVARSGWGAVGREVDEAQAVMKTMGIRGYLRERAAKSTFLIRLQEAIAKPGSLKPKGINDLDLWLLGDPEKALTLKGNPGGREGLNLEAITAIFRPEEDDVIKARMLQANQPQDVIDAVLERAKSRRKEWEKRRPEFDKFRKEGVDVEFNYRDNDTVPPNPGDPPPTKRAFDYEVVPNENGPDILVARMADESGNLKYVTGDIDWIHFSFLDGTPLDRATAARFYQVMNRCCQLQHGETIAWMQKGVTIFEDKANQLVDYITGKKALLEVSGDGKRAVRIMEKQSYISGTGRNNIIFFDNGLKSTALEALQFKARLEANFLSLFERFPPQRIVILNWLDRIGEVDWTITGGPDAEVIRESENGELEQFDGLAWTPWTPPVLVAAKGVVPLEEGEVHLSPMTTLEEIAVAGAIEMKLVPLNELWAEALEGRIDNWFTEGDVIVFDPGSVVQEIRKIVSLEPLRLDWPLDYFHTDATLVTVVPESMYSNIDRQDQVEVIQIIHNESDKTLKLATRIPFMALAHLESSPDMSNWEPITPLDVQGGLVTEDQLMVEYPGQTIEVTIDISNLSTFNKLFIRLRDAE